MKKTLIRKNPFPLVTIPLWGQIAFGAAGLATVIWVLWKLDLGKNLSAVGKSIPYLAGGTASLLAGKYFVPDRQEGLKAAAVIASLGLIGFGIYKMITFAEDVSITPGTPEISPQIQVA